MSLSALASPESLGRSPSSSLLFTSSTAPHIRLQWPRTLQRNGPSMMGFEFAGRRMIPVFVVSLHHHRWLDADSERHSSALSICFPGIRLIIISALLLHIISITAVGDHFNVSSGSLRECMPLLVSDGDLYAVTVRLDLGIEGLPRQSDSAPRLVVIVDVGSQHGRHPLDSPVSTSIARRSFCRAHCRRVLWCRTIRYRYIRTETWHDLNSHKTRPATRQVPIPPMQVCA